MHDLPDVLEMLSELPERVDRHDTRDVVLAELDRGRVLSAFVAAMVWGYGDRGYGPERVRGVLTGNRGRASLQVPVLSGTPDKLREAVNVVRDDGAAEAYRFMYAEGRIKYLGGAFFTKWIYFVSAVDGVAAENAAPIFDKQVATWLNAHAGMRLRPDRTASYRTYLSLLDEWGSQYDRTRVQVEQAIFDLARS